MSNWVGGLPPEPKAKEKAKKASRPASPPDGDHPKTFFGGAIPPIPPKLPKFKKNDAPPSKVILTGAGRPIQQEAPEPKQAVPKLKQEAVPKPKQEAAPEPKQGAPSVSLSATPPTPSQPQPPPASPVSEATPQSYTPPPPSSSVSEPAPESYTPAPPPKRFPSVFDTKPKKKRKKSKKKPKPKPNPPPAPKPTVECDDDVCGDQGEANLGQLASIFAICYIPATCQDDSSYDVEEEMASSGFPSPRSGNSDDVDDGPDIPPEVPSYMRSNKFAGVFGKKIDARNVVELDPRGWHPSATAPDDKTDTSNTVTGDASANALEDTGNIVSDDPDEPRNTGDHSIAQEIKQGDAPELVKLDRVSASPDVQKNKKADSKCGIM